MALIRLVFFLCCVHAAPLSQTQVLSVIGDKRQDGYIVKFKDGVNQTEGIQSFLSTYAASGAQVQFQYDPQTFNGFAGQFSRDTAEALSKDPNVDAVSEDSIWSTGPVNSTNTTQNQSSVQKWTSWALKSVLKHQKPSESAQSGAAAGSSAVSTLYPPRWNLYAVSHKTPALPIGPYDYAGSPSGGEGVDVYVLDTGIFTGHEEFGGRARWGTSIVGGSTDENGHGTHVSATIAGLNFGVAPKSTVIAVQVLDSTGNGPISGIIAGISWAIAESRKSGRPSVINLSLKGNPSTMLDIAVRAAVAAGVHVCAAAGNSDDDASQYSPGRVQSILTVGATDPSNGKASFSSYGAVVDVFAPGLGITSAWIGSADATHVLSGTSQATPHVSGTVALIISSMGQKSPADMSTTIHSLGLPQSGGILFLQEPA